MDRYNIYAGLGGSFGGANYKFTIEAKSKEEAEDIAYQEAVEEYEEYEGYHGLKTWAECAEELGVDVENEDSDDVNDLYNEEIESWIEYYAILTSEDKNISKEELVME